MLSWFQAALKLLAIPIVARLTTEAERHPRFRNLLINIAQANNRISWTVGRAAYDLSTDSKILPLSGEKAVQSAANLIGQTFVLGMWEGLRCFIEGTKVLEERSKNCWEHLMFLGTIPKRESFVEL
ncbi:hypothetical protein CASFOL_031950 [Castilleja foliolosa]|uniref:Uncharacterized protein n=1 Tax=Castilleja foliolosa TaxID=1961234 RepID=A0ABD3C105_9LAMI